jgi:hypothetical protein
MDRVLPRSTKVRYRSAAGLALGLAVLLGCWTFSSSSASAHYPLIQGKADCEKDGGWTVAFEATSWKQTLKDGGGNEHIDVAYQLGSGNDAGGDWKLLTWKPTYKFTEANQFKFTDMVAIPYSESTKAIHFKATPGAKWSNGNTSNDPHESDWIKLPDKCKPVPTTVPVTTVPPTTAPSTTVAPTTTKPGATTTKAPTTTAAPTTTVVAVSPTTVMATTTTTIGVGGGDLPVTGAKSAGLAAFAGALLLGGFFLLKATKANA